MANDLHPGDYVIALNALAKTAGILGGAIAAVWTSWSVKRSKRIAVAGLLVGAVLGFFVGTITALFLHPASAGHVVVVKRGAASLSSTLTSAIVASTAAAILSRIGMAALLRKPSRVPVFACARVGVGVGIALGCLSSLL